MSILKHLKYTSLAILALCSSIEANERALDPSSLVLSNNISIEATSHARLLGNVNVDRSIPVTFVLPLRNQEELESLIARMYDPSDALYKKYLSTSEFIERFSPTQEDYDKVIAYAKSLGMKVVTTHPNRTLLNVSGQVKSIEKAFNVQLSLFKSPGGRIFYAPNKNPEVPSSIASIIKTIVGLDNYNVWKPLYHKKEISLTAGSHAYPSGPSGGFAPGDIVKAYNISNTDGTGQSIALFELASYQASDINTYTSQFGLPNANLTNVLVDGGSSSGIDAEVTLDIELALALAPNSQIYVYEGPNSNQGVLDTYNKIATDNLAKQVSTSWGSGENLEDSSYLQSESAIFQQMAAQGQTIYAAAGDSGAYDNYANNNDQDLVVDDPASQPYVVGVGGTSLTVDSNTGAYVSESVWNDGLGNGAGGGGVSTVWPIPTWQQNVSTVYSKTNRNVPDVALNADTNTGYAIYFSGSWQIYGGTSCAAPLWAAFTANVNQQLQSNQSPALGFVNPALYTIGTGSSYGHDFNDVTTGNNLYYQAGVGYDNASGWGSFNGANLFISLTQQSAPSPQQSNEPVTVTSDAFVLETTLK
jgi:kumamolisin